LKKILVKIKEGWLIWTKWGWPKRKKKKIVRVWPLGVVRPPPRATWPLSWLNPLKKIKIRVYFWMGHGGGSATPNGQNPHTFFFFFFGYWECSATPRPASHLHFDQGRGLATPLCFFNFFFLKKFLIYIYFKFYYF
jgi:hypothetical protein